DGTINENGGKYAKMDRLQARDQIVEEMKAAGHFVEVEERKIELAHSDRSKTPIEPYLSDQWFVKMDVLAQSAIDAVEDKRVRFYPSRYAKTYLDWLGEKRDWCISRQLWWGHRIPIWSRVESRESRVEDLKEFGFAISADGVNVEFSDEYKGRLAACFAQGPNSDEQILLICVDQGNNDIQQKLEALGFEQDEDVLDTWFSSALWPQATLGWPDTDHNPPLDETEVAKQTTNPKSKIQNPKSGNAVLDYFYPGSVLITSRDIITLWVARMVLMGLYNMGDVPFQHVCIHPKILDGFGQGMSKSKGNGVDPMDLIDKYGTDAVRFTIAALAGETQDVRLPIGYECPNCETIIPQELKHQKAKPEDGRKPTVKCPKCKQESQFSSPSFDPDAGEPVAQMVSERFEYGRNFCNKLWNASRFAMLNLEGYTPEAVAESDLELEDRWILSRLSAVTAEINICLGRYQLDAATRAIREFTWNEFCDWYLEMIKPRLQDEDRKPVAQRVLVSVLDALLRLLQPFTPFICEELWQRLKELAPERGLPDPLPASQSVMIASWPEFPADSRDEPLEARFEQLQEMIVAVRNVRAVYNIASSTPLKLYVNCTDELAGEIQDVSSQFDNLAKTMLEAAGAGVERPSGSAAFTIGDANGYIPLEGVIDREAELKRQRTEAEKIQGFITGHEKKLANEKFVSKAPENVVNDVRETLAGLRSQLESLQKNIDALSDD
ncbi:MAG: class I tRNA ligase family protein, partial [Planctomycetes bacterium]|nr:class I tRNA ligase family protein [Planctomycetota bacterium]